MQQTITRTASLLAALATLAAAADQPFTRAPLQPPQERQPAFHFTLRDAAGKTVSLKNYRGKIVLLDFWATWCHGCKQEIPWFVEFQKKYGPEGFAVVGVSMDEDGWKVLKPFLAENPIPYRMLLGDNPTSKGYGIQNLPDTFLIDRKGRVAAVYKEKLVDRDDVEANIKALLSQR